MKPGLIQVFDGLRLTTQHLEHLQGGFHSAMQDLRQILGLGQVHQGFEVVPSGDRMITVMPGIAFDFQKNRIVADEPQTLEVNFAAGETLKFLCAKYEQIKKGIVDGRSTMIWDSCSLNLRTSQPGPEENEVVLCALKPNQKGGFSVISPSPPVSREEEKSGPSKESVPPVTPGSGPPGAVPPAGEAVSEAAGAAIIAGPEEAPAISPSIATARMVVKQGVLHLAGEGGDDLPAKLLAVLPGKLAGGGVPPAIGDYSLRLAGKEIPLDFPPLSLSCQTILRASVLGETGELSGSLNFLATAQGEATFSDRLLAQQAVSTIQKTCEKGGPVPGWAADLTEVAIAHLPFSLLRNMTAAPGCPELFALLEQLTLVIALEMGQASELQMAAHLVWQGQPSAEKLDAIQNLPFQLSWQSQHAWKAIGSR